MKIKSTFRTALLSSAIAGLLLPGAAFAKAAHDWSGYYAGVKVGAGFSDSTEWSGINVPSAPAQNYAGIFSTSNPNGVVGGIYGGYNFQYRPTFIIGVEGGVSASGLQEGDRCFGSPSYGDYSATCDTKIDWMADLAVRFGTTRFDRMFLYGKLGATYAKAKFQAKGPVASSGGYGTTSDHRVGFLVGLGAEYALNPKWTVGIEYEYRKFKDDRVNFTPTGVMNQFNPPFSAKTDLGGLSTVMVRLSHPF